MIARYLTQNKQITFEVEAATQVEILEAIASIQEVFDSQRACGICNSAKLQFYKRTSSGQGKQVFTYHGIKCMESNCRARFEFGHSEGGALFPARKDKITGKYVRSHWKRYQSDTSHQSLDQSAEDSEWGS